MREDRFAEELARYPDLFERMEEVITPQRAFAWFKRLADTYAPSLTVSYTRGPVVERLLGEHGFDEGGPLRFHSNYLGTGNVAIELGRNPCKPIWLMAHLDICSYLTRERRGNRYRLTPFCEPRKGAGSRAAVALAYSSQERALREVAQGLIVVEEGRIFFETEVTDLPPWTRVVYSSQAELDEDSNLVYGYVDNAFGCTALLLSSLVLSSYEADVLVVLTDEEEGVVATGNRAFSRGSARLFNRISRGNLPNLVLVSDMHEEIAALEEGHLDVIPFGQGALFAGAASEARGGVTPPPLLEFQRELAAFLAQKGISLRENPGYLSRSDCVSAMMYTPNVALVGYPGAYSHFADTPRAHLGDLVDLAKSLVVYALVAQSEVGVNRELDFWQYLW